jgi:hypothetical protein
MSNPSLIGSWILWDHILEYDIIILRDPRMDPDSRPCISRFFCWIVGSNIWEWVKEVFSEFVGCRFDLLHEENIRIFTVEKICEFSLLMSRADTIDVPRDDSHREIYNRSKI